MRAYFSFISFFLFMTFVVACSHPKKPSNYAKRIYLEQESKKQQKIKPPQLNELGEKDVLLDVSAREEKEWDRRSYESIDEWVTRMQELLSLNKETLDFSREELRDAERLERIVASQVAGFVKRNDELQRLINQPLEQLAREEMNIEAFIPADFTLYLIRKGDTLFSLATDYYESAEMVKDITKWNRGWIRHPDEIIAGIALVMFPLEAEEKKVEIVDEYLKKLRSENHTN